MMGRGASMPVRLYRRIVSPALPQRCRFYPTCSEYAAEALELNGLIRGGAQAAWRLVRCGPWHPGGVHHVRPLRTRKRVAVG